MALPTLIRSCPQLGIGFSSAELRAAELILADDSVVDRIRSDVPALVPIIPVCGTADAPAVEHVERLAEEAGTRNVPAIGGGAPMGLFGIKGVGEV